MGKPGPVEIFDTGPINVEDFIDRAKQQLDSFGKNMNNLKTMKRKRQSLFNWYMTFGFWNESLEYIDELEAFGSPGG